ncbi:hypothetical protein CCHR01_06008 [Colletotrichum chrysophilum]|uniref:Uncharacterized protein n=1 Tax=Colletotrichum chrysophilum TaxID=1836956 RepID=A0AAD9AQG5_9PEZI|nr:hypothetical protein CCHR01_06008 [Colletotrichum chrysophilum]
MKTGADGSRERDTESSGSKQGPAAALCPGAPAQVGEVMEGSCCWSGCTLQLDSWLQGTDMSRSRYFVSMLHSRFHGHPGFQVINGRNNTRGTISPLQNTDISIHRTRPRRRRWTGIGDAEWKPTAVDIGKAQQADTGGWHLAFLPPGPPAPSEASMEHRAAVCGRANRNLRNLWTGEPVVPWVRYVPRVVDLPAAPELADGTAEASHLQFPVILTTTGRLPSIAAPHPPSGTVLLMFAPSCYCCAILS